VRGANRFLDFSHPFVFVPVTLCELHKFLQDTRMPCVTRCSLDSGQHLGWHSLPR
jgi:hypothetical protein